MVATGSNFVHELPTSTETFFIILYQSFLVSMALPVISLTSCYVVVLYRTVVIRMQLTKRFIGRTGSGGTHVENTKAATHIPRLCRQLCVLEVLERWWLAGRLTLSIDGGTWFPTMWFKRCMGILHVLFQRCWGTCVSSCKYKRIQEPNVLWLIGAAGTPFANRILLKHVWSLLTDAATDFPEFFQLRVETWFVEV